MSLLLNCGCWHASPMSVSAMLTPAPGCSPWPLRPAPATLQLPSRRWPRAGTRRACSGPMHGCRSSAHSNGRARRDGMMICALRLPRSRRQCAPASMLYGSPNLVITQEALGCRYAGRMAAPLLSWLLLLACGPLLVGYLGNLVFSLKACCTAEGQYGRRGSSNLDWHRFTSDSI